MECKRIRRRRKGRGIEGSCLFVCGRVFAAVLQGLTREASCCEFLDKYWSQSFICSVFIKGEESEGEGKGVKGEGKGVRDKGRVKEGEGEGRDVEDREG